MLASGDGSAILRTARVAGSSTPMLPADEVVGASIAAKKMLPVLRSTAVVQGKRVGCATEYSTMRGAAPAVPAIAQSPATAHASLAHRTTKLDIAPSNSSR